MTRRPFLVLVLFSSFAYAAPKEVDPPMPALRVGSATMKVAPALESKVLERFADATQEMLLVEIPSVAASQYGPRVTVAVDAAFAFEVRTWNDPERIRRVWVRRTTNVGRPFVGHLYESVEPAVGQDTPFRVDDVAMKSTPATRTRFYADASESFQLLDGGPFYSFAANRLATLAGRAPARNGAPRRLDASDLVQLMETTTGQSSVQETLQRDRPLWIATQTTAPTIAMDTLKGPPLAKHPFAAMLALLPAKAPPQEALAALVPADFYFVRFATTDVLFKLLDQADAWGTPLVDVLDRGAANRDLSARYLAQLGLDRGPLSRALGTQVLGELAIAGSDPYVREVSDVTMLFAVKQPSLFDAALAAALATQAAKHGAMTAHTETVEGTTVTVTISTDGAVQQHRAQLGSIAIVSNSAGAMRRVLRAAHGTADKLSDEPDLRFMLARDPQRADAFAFLGDRFVQSVVGPRQKILASRRELALAELLEPGWSALLAGWLDGRAPRDLPELVASGWLRKDALKHADGSAIAFSPGTPARSKWGTPAALVPLIDLPTPAKVTQAESDAYARFSTGYQQYWHQYVDPVALRVNVVPDGKGSKLAFDLRVLPLIDGTDYRSLAEQVGRARVSIAPPPSGLRAVLGIGREAMLRRELSQILRANPFGHAFEIDWLGDWAMIGIEDRTQVARWLVAVADRELPQVPSTDRARDAVFAEAVNLPFYVGVGISAPAGAVLFLAGARKLVMDAAPGIVDWAEIRTKKGHAAVRISVKDRALSANIPGIQIYYALVEGAFYASLRESTLDALLDQHAKAKGTYATKDEAAAQLVADAASDHGPLSTMLGWFLEGIARQNGERSRRAAEAFLRGAPGLGADEQRALALAYEGAVPVTPDDKTYTLSPQGVADPLRGTTVQPSWPKVPVPGSPVEVLLRTLRRFRSELSFDDEVTPPTPTPTQPMRSLHVRASFTLAN